MNAADEKIPRRPGGEFLDPGFFSREEIAFQAEPDGELGEGFPGLRHGVEVEGEFPEVHPPVVEGGGHGVVVGKAELLESEFHGAPGELQGPAGGVAAERGVHVVVGKWHGRRGFFEGGQGGDPVPRGGTKKRPRRRGM